MENMFWSSYLFFIMVFKKKYWHETNKHTEIRTDISVLNPLYDELIYNV